MPDVHEVDNFLDGENVKELFGGEIITLLKTIITYMYCGIVVGSSNTGTPFILWNKRATEILGKGPINVPQESWPVVYGLKNPETKELLSPSDVPLAIAMTGKVVEDRLLLVDNGVDKVYINCTAYPVFKNDAVVGGVVVFQDMTDEIKKTELILQMQKQISKLEDINNQIKNSLT